MADIIVPEGSPVDGVQRYVRYVDQGDGTWAVQVASTGGGGGGGDASATNQASQIALATSLNGYVDGLETLVTTLNGYVDGLEGLITTQAGYLDGVEGELGSLTETAPASDTASSGLNGRNQRIAQNLTTINTTLGTKLDTLHTDITSPETALTNAGSTSAFQASNVLKASAGRLYSISVYNSGPGQWIHVGDSASVPANGAVSVALPPVWLETKGRWDQDFGTAGKSFAAGISVWNSTTEFPTKTLGAADCFFEARVGAV